MSFTKITAAAAAVLLSASLCAGMFSPAFSPSRFPALTGKTGRGIIFSDGSGESAADTGQTAAGDEQAAADTGETAAGSGETAVESGETAAGSGETAAGSGSSDTAETPEISAGSEVTLRCDAILHSTMSTAEDNLLAVIPAGTALTAQTSDGIWLGVSYAGQEGYLLSYTIVSEAQAAQGAQRIRALSADELAAIEASYSTEEVGYGAPLSSYKDGRSEYAVAMQNRMSVFQNVYCFGDTSSDTVYLTFSCGWENGTNTSRLLDILKEYGIHAVFYVTHEYASSNPELVQRMISEGHEIGNESYSHPDPGLPSLSLEEQMQDTLKMQNYIQDNFNYTMTKYNFPSSEWSMASVAMLTQMGYDVCFYSFNYNDYNVDSAEEEDADSTASMLLEALTPGCIYYLHPVSTANIEAMPSFIEGALERGYTFGTFGRH